MATNVMDKFGTDYGLSVTGIAGPGGGTDEKPVGLVYIGLADSSNTEVREYKFGTDRNRNKVRSSQAALNWLRLTLQND
jgi:nicotinamide-nucleotide amidase